MAVLDRVVRWNLDFDGDIYGDERERLRWYEGIATAASMQWLAIPWAAAILVWALGRPAVLPLAVVLVVMVVPMILCNLYVRRRRVDTEVRRWSAKRVLLSAGFIVPVLAFYVGARHAYDATSSEWHSTALGGLLGGVLGTVATIVGVRRKRRQEDSIVEDES